MNCEKLAVSTSLFGTNTMLEAVKHMSRATASPTRLHVRPVKTHISLRISAGCCESSLSAWRRLDPWLLTNVHIWYEGDKFLLPVASLHNEFLIKTRTVISEENVCPPISLNRHIVKIDCIYNKLKVTIYLYVSLVKIHPFLNETGCWQANFF